MTNLNAPDGHTEGEPYCNGCGDCCRGMDEEFGVEIQDSDAERIAAFLQLDTEVFLAEYTEVEWEEVESGEHVPVNYLIPQADDPKRACIFLENNRCAIHEAKPVQCYLGWPDAEFLQRLSTEDPHKQYSCLPESDEATVVHYPML